MIDLEQVGGFIRETAATEILPRFRMLAASDIREKKPGDLVTVADTEAERRLTRLLEAAVPGSVALGEESVAEDPAQLGLISGAAPVWIIDPVDGTGNFAKGLPGFAVIVAYVEDGVARAGWIYDPMGDVMVAATRGGGAWSRGVRLAVIPSQPPDRFVGSAYGRTPRGVRSAQALTESGRIGAVRNRGSSGLEYIDVATGVSDFSLHSRSLPWDHAAGMLIAVEAGGVARFLDGSTYDPRIPDRPLLAAASDDAWRLIHDIVTAPA
jgi:fructose-1,6-bisphosphatase/inositol monophosphatase family enzyme